MSLRDRLLEPRGLFEGALFRDMLRTHFDIGELRPGDRVGAYRIARELGRGGMGVVYLAKRADGEFEQSVALKWLPDAGMAQESAALFRRERQILAELSHPNIARLIDGGHTAEGHLWFAMELVEGLPIDRHAQANRLGDRERIRLIMPVIEAVEFAHARLLIHRDIKPGNVMIDAEGRPRLLDFGIAALSQESEHAHAFTPEYASPEQRALQPVGTASDIWQLGRLLEAVLSIGRSTPLPEDLRAIVATATATASQDRYVTAAALKHDLQRYLARQPVLARQGGLAYRLALLVKRHPLSSITTALGAITLVSLVAGFLYYADVERERLRRARDETLAINGFLNTDVLGAGDPILGNAGDAPISDILEASVDKAEQRFAGHPAIAGQIQTAIGMTLLRRGLYPAAEHAAERAIALLSASEGEQATTTGEARLLRAMVDLHNGDPQAAKPKLEALEKRFPFDDRAPSLLAWRIQSALGGLASMRDQSQDCLRIHERILAHVQGIPDDEVSDGYNGLSFCQNNLNLSSDALRSARLSEFYGIRFGGPDSGIASLARIRAALAQRGLGRHEDALQSLHREVDNLTRLLGPYHSLTVTYVDALGSTYLCANDSARAAPILARAVVGRHKTVGAEHPWALATTAQQLAALIRQGRTERAAELVEWLEARGPIRDSNVTQVMVDRALGEWYLRKQRPEQAVAHFRGARDTALASREQFRTNMRLIESGLGLGLSMSGREDEALAAYARSQATPDRGHCTNQVEIDAEADNRRLLSSRTP